MTKAREETGTVKLPPVSAREYIRTRFGSAGGDQRAS